MVSKSIIREELLSEWCKGCLKQALDSIGVVLVFIPTPLLDDCAGGILYSRSDHE